MNWYSLIATLGFYYPYPFVQTVCVLSAVRQALRECVAAGVAQRRVFPALQTSLSQQNGPDLTHGLTPLFLPAR